MTGYRLSQGHGGQSTAEREGSRRTVEEKSEKSENDRGDEWGSSRENVTRDREAGIGTGSHLFNLSYSNCFLSLFFPVISPFFYFT